MRKEIPRSRSDGRRAKIVVALAACLALGWTCIGDAVDRPPDAVRQPDTRQRIAELEKTFWQCEQAASTGMIDAAMAAYCDAVADELKKRKFGGDFERLLQWWQQNKLAWSPGTESGPVAEASA
jgi:hypothetical protein